jgi:hypothetical protein
MAPTLDALARGKAARKAAPQTAGAKWFDLPAPKMTDELKRDLRLLRLRGAYDPKRFYKSFDNTKFPKHFAVRLGALCVCACVCFEQARVMWCERCACAAPHRCGRVCADLTCVCPSINCCITHTHTCTRACTQIGTVLPDPLERPASRQRGASLADQLLADAELTRARTKRYARLQEEAQRWSKVKRRKTSQPRSKPAKHRPKH